MTIARFPILLCLLIAVPVAAADNAQRFSGQALLAPAAGAERFQMRARLAPGEARAAGRYQLSARLQSDAQTKVVSAVCTGIFTDSFE